MRRLALIIAACFCFLYAHAAYLKDVPTTLTQPDGTILHCFASGDEFFNYLHDANGYTIMQHPVTGYYVYADKKDGKLVATDFVVGEYDPASKHLTPYNLISPEEWRARRKAWEVPVKRQRNRDFIPNHGTLNNISIFIRFSDDDEFTNTFSSIDNMFNDDSENAVSMKTYFRSASYGAIEIPTYFYPGHNGETIISYQDINPKSYFQPYNASTNPNGYNGDDERRNREFDLLERAVNYINENYPIPTDLNIDYDNDGYVDNVCFIVKGNTVGWGGLLWPHQWSLYDRTVYINGKVVGIFNFQLADATNYFKTTTMCHEMNHSLGAPDLYHYDEDILNPIGRWDLMATNSTPPQHCGAYMKMKYGHWIDEIPEITQAGTYTLNPISSPTPENVAYKIATEDPNQFYVLEYRNTSTPFESGLPGSGLLIYRIDTRFHGNADYDPSNDIYDEIYIFRPGGAYSSDGNPSNAFFSSSSGRNEFSPSTSPYPFYSEGTLDNNFRIYNITNAGNTISFTYGTVSACVAPTNITATVSGRNVLLAWDAANNAQSYNIYRNGNFIGNTNETTFVDNNVSFGTHTYFIKSVDAQGILSAGSETVTAIVEPIASGLTAKLSGNEATLSWTAPEWCYPETPLYTLTYGTQNNSGAYFSFGTKLMYWGHRHLTGNLSSYQGLRLYSIDFHSLKIGSYELCIYEGSTTTNGGDYTVPLNLVYSQSITATTSGWNTIDLEEPYYINSNQDLWIFIHNTEAFDNLQLYLCSAEGNNGVYYSGDLSSYIYNNASGYAFLIKTYLTDGTYTYNLYDNGTLLNNESPIADTSYTVENIACNTIHQYTVTTNYSGGESTPSNKAYLVMGTHTQGNLDLGTNDKMTITEDSKLTVSGTLINNNPSHLIIEDGAQLINDSEGVKATVKKAIQPYTEDLENGWNLIASPIIESLDAGDDVVGLVSGAYDLYIFDQNGSNGNEWRNYEAQTFTAIDNKVGYLYSNSNETTISFAGTLAGTVTPTTITRNDNVEFEGFNLIGNPYPCEVYTNQPYYTLQYNEEDDKTCFVLDESGSSIPPCTAILVQAQTAEESVTFSKTPLAKQASIAMRLTKSNTRSTRHIDQARISFEAGCQLSKYTWDNASSMIYIPQNGQNYAVAYANGANEMPINFKAAHNGTYTLGFETHNLELDYLHLIDNMTGDDVDILATPRYTFDAKTSDYASRFRLVFSNGKNAVDDDEPFAYVNNGEIVINQEGTLQIVDMTGRVVISRYGRMQCVPTTGMAQGVYVLRLINGENVKTQKIVID